MKALRVLLLSGLAICLLTVAAYGAGVAVRHGGWPSTPREHEGIALTPATRPPTPGPTSPSSPSPTPVAPSTQALGPASALARVPDVLVPGDRGELVRELQSRLHQLAWFPELTTGTYDAATRGAVRGFQAKRGLEATGRVDPRTWRRLGAMTRTPTDDELHNVLHPGPALLATGARGEEVRDLQARLVATSWLSGEVSGTYDAPTVAAVRGFQAKRRVPVTGEVDARTLERLHAMTATPTYEQKHGTRPATTTASAAALDPRCGTGRALCVDKSTNSLRWVVDGRVLASYDVRFGSDELPTREGAFSVYRKSRDHVSNLFGTSMPFAMFFSGGQAVHYSPDFAAHGYDGASHGCVNVRDYNGVAALFDQVRVGDKVIVYRS